MDYDLEGSLGNWGQILREMVKSLRVRNYASHKIPENGIIDKAFFSFYNEYMK